MHIRRLTRLVFAAALIGILSLIIPMANTSEDMETVATSTATATAVNTTAATSSEIETAKAEEKETLSTESVDKAVSTVETVVTENDEPVSTTSIEVSTEEHVVTEIEMVEKEEVVSTTSASTFTPDEPLKPAEQAPAETTSAWQGTVLTAKLGVVQGPSGKETYYNLPMGGVVKIMRQMGYTEEEYPYHVREDGVKMLGDYVMVAANLDLRPRGSILECSLGTALVCDTGAFAVKDQTQLDIAVDW